MELDYQVDLMRATALRSRADELAEELIKFGELASAGKLIGNNRDLRIATLRKLVEEIKNDQAQLEKFRWAYSICSSAETRGCVSHRDSLSV